MKQFNFIFNGHEYTVNDRAGNQGRCPHCDARATDKFMFDTQNDNFIGYHKFSDTMFAYCFECVECHKKFYYHMPVESMINKESAEKQHDN